MLLANALHRLVWYNIHQMKLEYSKRGLQFFFITLVVAERRPVLSRIVDEKSRPALMDLGEIVVAALRAVHRTWNAATISDFVIMPDHIHFLLIVDYNRDMGVSPLFLTHRLADAIEIAFACGLDAWVWRTDGAPPRTSASPSQLPGRLDAARKLELVERMKQLLFEAVAIARETEPGELKVEGGLRFGELRGGSGRSPVRSVVFARDCYIELSFDARQLKATRRYIKLNPARAIWKARHPDFFVCHRAIKAARFAPFAPRRFDGIGALPILGSPFLFHVRLTLKKTIAEHEAAIEDIVEKARRGMVPVSGFISPGEKEALRRLKAEPRARFVKLLPNALPARYDPSAEDSREIAAGRLVILSAFHDTPAISSYDMKRNPAAAHRFRRNCLEMNDLAAMLCS